MSENETIRKVLLEGDLSSFKDFFDLDWVKSIYGLIEDTSIERIVGNFMVSWWGNARAFVLPWLLVTGVSDIINEFSQNNLDLPPQKVWDEYLKHHEFNIALWKLSENVYCSIYFAYENLIVNVLKEILGTSIRVTQRDFNEKLVQVYGQKLSHKIWHQTFVHVARETRNSIVHNGSKATNDLLKIKPLLYYIQDGDVVVSASVTQELSNKLKPLVYEFVKESLQKINQ